MNDEGMDTGQMNEKNLVKGYIDAILEKPEIEDEEVVSALTTKGVDKTEVVAASHFTQIAFGRYLLDDKGILFDENYVRMRPNGEIYERGRLESNPMYIEARRLAATLADNPAFPAIALRSPEVAVMHHMLQRGKDPSGMNLSPVIIIDSPPTEEGMRVVKALIESESYNAWPVN